MRPCVLDRPRLDSGGIGMRAGVGDVVDAHVQVADLRRRAVGQREMAAGHDAVELAGRPPFDLPSEHLGVEPPGGLGIVARQIDEDQACWAGS